MQEERSPKVAPYESCVACFKGDTRTIVQLAGEAEWHVAGLSRLADIPIEQANATFLVWAEEERGCEPGMVPGGWIESGFRLCRECAARTGAKITEPGEAGVVYTQPDEMRGDA